MKKNFILLILLAAFTQINAQTFETLKDRNGNKMYCGFITDSILKNDTACHWFSEAQKIYTPKESLVKTFSNYKDSVSFVIFLGTWCGDSHYVVPRIMKIIEAAGYSPNKITLIAVDRKKKDIVHLAEAFQITNVPTIIPFKKGRELGRVIEYGNTGRYEEEVAALLSGN